MPMVQNFIEIMKEIYVTEKLSFSVKLPLNTFQSYWGKWIQYISDIETRYFN